MRKRLASLPMALAAVLAVSVAGVPALAQSRDDQGQVRREMKAGNVQSLREIEGRILPQMRGMQYLGPEYDAAAMAYRLKFIHDGRVMFVDVDARSGRVMRRSR
ncbi:MAG: hypothetical protein WCY92_07860 [Novosphingobium sp.]